MSPIVSRAAQWLKEISEDPADSAAMMLMAAAVVNATERMQRNQPATSMRFRMILLDASRVLEEERYVRFDDIPSGDNVHEHG